MKKLLISTLLVLVCGQVGAEEKTISDQTWSLDDFTIGKVYNITYASRTFEAKRWDLISLPFDASKEVLDNTFGSENYELQQLEKLEGTAFVFKKMAVPFIDAGKSYLIKVKTAVEAPIFRNVTFKTKDGEQVEKLVFRDNLKYNDPFWTLFGGRWMGPLIGNKKPIR